MKPNLSSSEAYLWQYMQDNIEAVPGLSIVRLSEAANVSTATIVRTMKKMGYSGYTAFRQQKLTQQANQDKYANLAQVDQDIRQAIMKNAHEVDNTLAMLEVGTIEDAVQKISNAPKIYIFARGFSELIAKEMMVKFQLLEKNCEMHDDPNIIRPISKRIPKTDVLILITLNGETPELVEAAKNAMKNKVCTITLTTNSEGPIVPMTELLFLGYKSEISYFPEYEVRSRLPLQVMSRILLDAYAIRTQ